MWHLRSCNIRKCRTREFQRAAPDPAQLDLFYHPSLASETDAQQYQLCAKKCQNKTKDNQPWIKRRIPTQINPNSNTQQASERNSAGQRNPNMVVCPRTSQTEKHVKRPKWPRESTKTLKHATQNLGRETRHSVPQTPVATPRAVELECGAALWLGAPMARAPRCRSTYKDKHINTKRDL